MMRVNTISTKWNSNKLEIIHIVLAGYTVDPGQPDAFDLSLPVFGLRHASKMKNRVFRQRALNADMVIESSQESDGTGRWGINIKTYSILLASSITLFCMLPDRCEHKTGLSENQN
jgi:hypothetical protein